MATARIVLILWQGRAVRRFADGVLYNFAGDLHAIALLAGAVAPCRWSQLTPRAVLWQG